MIYERLEVDEIPKMKSVVFLMSSSRAEIKRIFNGDTRSK
jgi:hypothetical protein